MKISIIVPYKDAADYIDRCAESLRTQDGDFEFIFVNDNETNNPAVIEIDDRFILVNNVHKHGVGGARNTGLDYATGEWITFLDADDIMCPNAYTIFTNAIKAANDFNILQFNHYRHYSKIGRTALKYTNNANVYTLKSLPVLWCCVWNKLYRADFIKGIKFNESLRFGEDELFNVECLARDGRIRCFDTISTTHIFENVHSLSKSKTETDLFRMNKEYAEVIKKHKDPELRRALCLRLSTHWSHLFLDYLTGDKK